MTEQSPHYKLRLLLMQHGDFGNQGTKTLTVYTYTHTHSKCTCCQLKEESVTIALFLMLEIACMHVRCTWPQLHLNTYMTIHSGLTISRKMHVTHVLTPISTQKRKRRPSLNVISYFFPAGEEPLSVLPLLPSLFPTIHSDLTTWEWLLCSGKIKQNRVTFCFAPSIAALSILGNKTFKVMTPSYYIRLDDTDLTQKSNFLTFFCLKIHLFVCVLVTQWFSFHF